MKRAELFVEIAFLAAGCWFVYSAVSSAFIAPLHDTCAAYRTRIAEAREKQRLTRELRDLVPLGDAQLKEKLATLSEIQGYLLKDQTDRLWVVELQERLWKKFRDLQITAEQGSTARPISIRPAMGADGSMPELAAYARLVGKEGVPLPARSEASAFKLEARFRLIGPYASVLACLAELEAQPYFLEVTRLEARYERRDAARGDRMGAIVVVASTVLQDQVPPVRQ